MSDVKQCPYCAEDIKAAAKKCKHCGEMLSDVTAAKATSQPPEVPASPSVDEVLYSKHGLEVTSRLIKAPNVSFQMANLNGVRVSDLSAAHAGTAMGCGGCTSAFGLLLLLSTFYAFESSGGLGLAYMLFGALALGIGVSVIQGAKKGNHWVVQLNSNKAWVNLCDKMEESDARDLEKAVNDGFSKLRSSK